MVKCMVNSIFPSDGGVVANLTLGTKGTTWNLRLRVVNWKQ